MKPENQAALQRNMEAPTRGFFVRSDYACQFVSCGIHYKTITQVYDIEIYEDARGKAPFNDWLLKLKDKPAQAKLQARIDRASLGNFGDWKDIKGAKGVFEMREHYGQGYRIFYTVIGRKIVLLLAGSTKSQQNKGITKAKEYLADFERRK